MTRVWLCVVLVVSGLGAGCATLRNRADTALSKGDYVEAAELFDQILKRDPSDTEALAGRTQARHATLRMLLANSQAARQARRVADATAALDRLLEFRNRWETTIDGIFAVRIANEVAATGSAIAAIVDAKVAGGLPLAAERELARYQRLLARTDFGSSLHDLRQRTRRAGLGTCDRLTSSISDTAPYWSWYVDRYCQHWGVAARQDIVLPHTRSDAVIEGSIAGETDAQVAALRAALGAAFRDSVWFSPRTSGAARGSISGRISATFSSRSVSLARDWTEQVPYTDYETIQVSYQEPYEDTETTVEQVPYTEYQTRKVPCGGLREGETCDETYPVTVYRSETRTNTVTRYRTAWRDETRPVTRYRDVPHVFSYVAIEHTGHYQSELGVTLDVGAVATVAAEVANELSRRGVDHDITFEPAGVYPERANLLTLADFVNREQQTLRSQLLNQLDERYRSMHCTATMYTIDQAAACAYLAPTQLPDAAHAALRAMLGDDEPLAISLLAR
ncbi:MAG: hypothetical protein AB7P03_21405 [Kofleriaceae bacterium]